MSNLNLYQDNVAFAGFEENLNIYTFYRTQWQAIQGQPRQFNLNATLPMHILRGGVGASLESYTNGAENISTVEVSYNRILATPYFKYSGGASIGMSQVTIDQSKLITPDGTYVGSSIDHKDPRLNNTKQSALYPQYSIAGFLSHNVFDIGVSASNIIQSTNSIENITYTQSLNIDFVGIYYLPIKYGYVLESGIVGRTNFDNLQVDLFSVLKYGNIFGGLSLRGFSQNSFESISLMGGIKFDEKYTIAYNYDVLIGRLGAISDGSHEIMLKYNFEKEINTGLPPKTMYSPRNL